MLHSPFGHLWTSSRRFGFPWILWYLWQVCLGRSSIGCRHRLCILRPCQRLNTIGIGKHFLTDFWLPSGRTWRWGSRGILPPTLVALWRHLATLHNFAGFPAVTVAAMQNSANMGDISKYEQVCFSGICVSGFSPGFFPFLFDPFSSSRRILMMSWRSRRSRRHGCFRWAEGMLLSSGGNNGVPCVSSYYDRLTNLLTFYLTCLNMSLHVSNML